MKVKHVPVDAIHTDGLQTRAAISVETVREYAEASTTGKATLPPIIVFEHTSGEYWLADGFHRLAAAKQTGQKRIAAEIRTGSRTDALRFALGANGSHGLRRTNADKAHAVKMAYEHRKELDLPDVPSANAIAELVGVSHHTVEAQLGNLPSWREATSRTGTDGRTRELPDVPSANSIAGLVGVSHPTVEAQLGNLPSWREATSRTGTDGRTRELPPVPTRLPVAQQPVVPETVPPVPTRNHPIPPSEPPTRKPVVPQSAPPAPSAKTEHPEDDGPVDELGHHIPDDLMPIWNRRQEVQDLCTLVSKARTALKAAQDGKDPLWAEINFSITVSHLDRAYTELSAAKPWCVCPMCQGIGCRACKGVGLMGQYRYDQVVPREFKKEK